MADRVSISKIDNGWLIHSTGDRTIAARTYEELAQELWTLLGHEDHRVGDRASLVVCREGLSRPADKINTR